MQPFRRRDCEVVESADGGSASEGGAADAELEEEQEEKANVLRKQENPREAAQISLPPLLPLQVALVRAAERTRDATAYLCSLST